MKGISTILAMILIVIIVVALIGLTYTFAVGLFSTTTSGATQQTTAVTDRLQKSVAISSASCGNTTSTNLVINFTIRHTGTIDLKAGDIAAILDGGDISTSTFSGGTSIDQMALIAGKVKSFGYASTRVSASRTLVISVPAGDISWPFTNCPT